MSRLGCPELHGLGCPSQKKLMLIHVCNQNLFTLIFRYYYYSVEQLGGREGGGSGGGTKPGPKPVEKPGADPKPAPPGLPAPYVALRSNRGRNPAPPSLPAPYVALRFWSMLFVQRNK